MSMFLKQGNKLDGIYYRIKIWRFYIWFADYRKSDKDYMPKTFHINCYGYTK